MARIMCRCTAAKTSQGGILGASYAGPRTSARDASCWPSQVLPWPFCRDLGFFASWAMPGRSYGKGPEQEERKAGNMLLLAPSLPQLPESLKEKLQVLSGVLCL